MESKEKEPSEISSQMTLVVEICLLSQVHSWDCGKVRFGRYVTSGGAVVCCRVVEYSTS